MPDIEFMPKGECEAKWNALNQQQDYFRKSLDGIKKTVYGDNGGGLKIEVERNARFRKSMEQTWKNIERKLIWAVVVILLWQFLNTLAANSDRVMHLIK